jgi:hypothetical protein
MRPQQFQTFACLILQQIQKLFVQKLCIDLTHAEGRACTKWRLNKVPYICHSEGCSAKGGRETVQARVALMFVLEGKRALLSSRGGAASVDTLLRSGEIGHDSLISSLEMSR